MKKLAPLALILCFILPFTAYAEEKENPETQNSDHFTATEIITQIDKFNDKEVVLRGEAAVEPLERGDFVWLNVFDGSISIGVWMKKELITPIKYYSGYKTRGDIIEVVGTAYRADPETNGELDIRATTLRVIEQGGKIPEHFPAWKIITAILLLGIAGFYVGRWISESRKSRKKAKENFELGTIFNEDIE